MNINGHEVISIRKEFMKVDYEGRTSNIWEKRKCFMCYEKFKHGELVTAVLTKGKNLLACEKCSQELLKKEK